MNTPHKSKYVHVQIEIHINIPIVHEHLRRHTSLQIHSRCPFMSVICFCSNTFSNEDRRLHKNGIIKDSIKVHVCLPVCVCPPLHFESWLCSCEPHNRRQWISAGSFEGRVHSELSGSFEKNIKPSWREGQFQRLIKSYQSLLKIIHCETVCVHYKAGDDHFTPGADFEPN